jgi:RHS repeat-associated protein
MRKGSTLFYLLTDHLGSTSLTTNSSGTLGSELRYKAWGETRYTSGTMPTKYTYTGQYSNLSDFGLMFYNARWYDPALGRFAQADTVVPGGVQGYDRYAYVGNSPVNYVDPTGHICSDPDDRWGNTCDGADSFEDYGGSVITSPQNNVLSFMPQPSGEPTSIPSSTAAYNEFFRSLVPLTQEDVCYLITHDAILCSAEALKSITDGFSSGPFSIQSLAVALATGYVPGAFGIGGGAIAGIFPAQGTGGIDILYISESNSVTIYGYDGTSLNTAGGSLVGGPYAIVGFNINEPTDYSGVSNTANLTFAYGHGATISYFWSGKEPFEPGAPQGLALWYSPGLGASGSYSEVNYFPWASIP